MASRKSDLKFLMDVEVRHPIKAAALLYTPPSFVLRGPIYLVFVFVVLGIAYLSWAKKDLIVTAPLTLTREANTVQSVGSGIVSEVLVQGNAGVRAGQPLVVIQEKVRAIANPEQESIQKEIRELEANLDKAITDYDHRISQLRLDLANAEKGRSTEQVALEGKIATIRQQIMTARAAREDYVRKLSLARRNFATAKELYDRRDATVTEFQRAQEAMFDVESAVRNAEAEVQKLTLAQQTAEQELSRMMSLTNVDKIRQEIAQQGQNRERDIERLQLRIAELRKKLSEADTLVEGVTFQDSMAKYRSSVDGIVTNVHVKQGQLIDAGMPLVTIVRESAALIAQVLVQNKDIGHLKLGQLVQIKYFAYPYQEYGIATGLIAEISTKPSELPGKESLYLVRVALDRESIRAPSGVVKPLEIGLEGIAEIKTGEKRWIEIIFTPLSKFFRASEE